MKTYIATFSSHFDAMRFHRFCRDQQWEAEMMPVPRQLSSSCGTCVRFTTDKEPQSTTFPVDLECLAMEEPHSTFTVLFQRNK